MKRENATALLSTFSFSRGLFDWLRSEPNLLTDTQKACWLAKFWVEQSPDSRRTAIF